MTSIYKIIGLAGALALGGTQSASAISLVYTPQTQTVNLFSQAKVDVNITGLVSQFVGSYDFFVGWDSTILSLASVTTGNFTGDGSPDAVFNYFTPIGSDSAEVQGYAVGDLLNQDGNTDINLFTFTFNTLAIGTSTLTFADGITGLDTNGNLIPVGSLGDDQGITLLIPAANKVPGSITVAGGPGPGPGQVPEPSVILLFGAGLMGWSISRRRGRNAV